MGKKITFFVYVISIMFIFVNIIYAFNEPKLNDIKTFADAEVKIEKLRKAKNPNWDEILTQIKKNIKNCKIL